VTKLVNIMKYQTFNGSFFLNETILKEMNLEDESVYATLQQEFEDEYNIPNLFDTALVLAFLVYKLSHMDHAYYFVARKSRDFLTDQLLDAKSKKTFRDLLLEVKGILL